MNEYGLKSSLMDYDISKIWQDDMYDLRNRLATELSSSVSQQMDLEVLERLKEVFEEPKTKSKEERVVNIVKQDFENHFNMTIQEFQEIYEKILKNNPEKLI
jgi:transcriptional regulator CtsR